MVLTIHNMMWMVIFMQCMIRLRAAVYGIILIFLKKPELQRMHLQTGILLEKQWKKSVPWMRMCMDTLQDRAPAIL